MTIYKVNYITKEADRIGYSWETKYFTNKENAEKFVEENDWTYTNFYGITTHHAKMGKEIVTED